MRLTQRRSRRGTSVRVFKRKTQRKKESEQLRSGRFTYFPDKQVTRSWRITHKTDDKLREIGQKIVDPERVDPETGDARTLGAADALEALVALHADDLTIEKVKKISKKLNS